MIKLKNILPESIYWPIRKFYDDKINPFYVKSYSQEGEDLILNRILDEKKGGFYIDVGAHHPKRFSNTYFFYKRGWRGINIEARPGSKKLFDKIRPRDINLEIPISEKDEELIYYIFNDPALNGFSSDLSKEIDGHRDYKILSEIKLKTKTLKSVLDDYLPLDQKIDFLSVDVEGFDFQVLKSNDWATYKPKLILVEDKDFSFSNLNDSAVFAFLSSKKYLLIAKSFNTLFFQLKETI